MTRRRHGARRSAPVRCAYAFLVVAALFAAHAIHPASAGAHGENSPIVALFTDYGTQDQYVGVIKGALLRICSDARLVDITHEVPAYDVRLGAQLLYLAAREFPPSTVFLAVVDPGVGTSRRPIVLQTKNGMRFVGPDNGLFTLVADSLGIDEVRVLSNSVYFNTTHTLSSTFHGRDIFAPVAGWIACGTAIGVLGPEAGEIVRLPFKAPTVAGGVVTGEVERVDVYGNVLTNISSEHLSSIGASPGDTLSVRLGKTEALFPWVHTYGDVKVGSRVALVASAGEMELALNQKSLGEKTGAVEGMPVVVRRRGR